MNTHIYKIFWSAEWAEFTAKSVFAGSADDKRDGFIHFSTWAQVPGTLEKYYSDGADVIIAEIDGGALGVALLYEASRGGDLFPHFYADLNLSAVLRHWRLAAQPDGSYILPEIEG